MIINFKSPQIECSIFLIGEPLHTNEADTKGPLTEYDKLVESFYTKLQEQRKLSLDTQEKNRKFATQKIINKFPGWSEKTINNLHSLFLLFDQNLNGMLTFEDLYVYFAPRN